jgi:hypothetical protein
VEDRQRDGARRRRQLERGQLRVRHEVAADDPQLVHLGGRHVGAELADPPRPGQHPIGPFAQLLELLRQRSEVEQPPTGQP